LDLLGKGKKCPQLTARRFGFPLSVPLRAESA
jgi:hypothetical protein